MNSEAHSATDTRLEEFKFFLLLRSMMAAAFLLPFFLLGGLETLSVGLGNLGVPANEQELPNFFTYTVILGALAPVPGSVWLWFRSSRKFASAEARSVVPFHAYAISVPLVYVGAHFELQWLGMVCAACIPVLMIPNSEKWRRKDPDMSEEGSTPEPAEPRSLRIKRGLATTLMFVSSIGILFGGLIVAMGTYGTYTTSDRIIAGVVFLICIVVAVICEKYRNGKTKND